jgi:hypothetical protein
MLECKPRTDGMGLDGYAYAGSRLYRTDLPELSAKLHRLIQRRLILRQLIQRQRWREATRFEQPTRL